MWKQKIAILSSVLMICLHQLGLSQTILYTPETKFGFRKNEFQIVGRTAQKNYTYRTDNDKHFMDIYSDELASIAIVELDFIPKNAQAIKFITNAAQLTVLYQYNSNNNCYLMGAQLNVDGKLMSKPTLLDSAKTSNGLFTRNNAIFDYTISDNNRYISFYHRYEQNKQEYLNIKLLNDKLAQIGNKDLLLSGTPSIYPQQFVISNKGTLFFSSYIYSNSNDHLSDYADIYTIEFNKDQFTKHAIPLEKLWIDQMQLSIDQEQDAVNYAALYSSSRKKQIEGVLTGKVFQDEDKAPTSNKNSFTEATLQKLGTKKNKKYLENFTLKEVIIKKDGGIIMVAESFFITTKTSVPNAGFYASYYATTPSRSIKEYNYGDILIINFNKDGTIVWENFIRKNQYSQEDYGMFSSYAFANTGKYLIFIYNDFTNHKNALTMATLDNNGKITYKQIKVSDQPYDWVPKHAKQTSALSILFPCFKSNTLLYSGVYF